MASRRYLNFDLLLEQEGDGQFQARVTGSPLGETPSVRFRLPFDATTLENLLLKLDPGRSGTRRVGGTSEQQAAMDFGGPLYQSIFTGDLLVAWSRSLDRARDENAGVRLRLRLNDAAAIAGLPWELLYDAKTNAFLAQSERTPLVRFLDVPQVPRPITVDGPLRVLAIISSPSDLEELDVEAEWRRIGQALAPRVESGLVVVDRLPSATIGELGPWLRRHETHVIHFVGHGDFDDRLREGVIYFQDQHGRSSPVTSSVLGPYVRDHDPLRMVVLNACRSARVDGADPFGGMAQGLVQQDATAVVAMQFPISDRAAVTFTGEFYGALVDGLPVDQAVSSARKALLADFRDEWATPVLFLRSPDGNIFENVHAASGAVPPPPPPPLVPTPPPRPPGSSFLNTVGLWVRQHTPVAAGAAAAVVGLVVVLLVVSQLGGDDDSSATDDPTEPTTAVSPTESTSTGTEHPVNAEELPASPELTFRELLVAAGRDTSHLKVYRVDLDAGTAIPISPGDGLEQAPALGPKRDTFVFTRVQSSGSRTLFVAAPDGTGVTELFEKPLEGCGRSVERPAWPKGGLRRVVVVCRASLTARPRLIRVGFDGVEQRDYLVQAGDVGDPAISLDAQTLMYWANKDPDAQGGFLWQVPLAGGNPTQITFDEDPADGDPDPDQDSDAVFSPDGNLMAFRRSGPDGVRHIWLADADGDNARQVTFGLTDDQDPTFSPLTDFIAFKHDEAGDDGRPTGSTRIYVIPVTDPTSPPPAPVPLLTTPIDTIETLPAWSRR